MEKWKNIIGYEGRYQVSSFGRVKSLPRWSDRNCRRQSKYFEYKMLPEKVLSPAVSGRYAIVTLCKDGKKVNKSVHRLVAEAFIPNPDNLPEVNHKDCNRYNNRLENLEWCDREYNINYGNRTKLAAEACEKKVKCIETGTVYASLTRAASELNLQKSKICLVCRGKRLTTGGLHWEYVS